MRWLARAWDACWGGPGLRPSTPPVEPDPPPLGVPLDETAAPVHYEGDTGSV